MTSLKIGCIQMNSGSDMQANIARFESFTAQAAGQGAELIATPENTFMMECGKMERVLYTMDTHPGIASAISAARKHQCWILVGSAAVTIDDSQKTANRSLLINPNGEIAAHYDKLHMFDAVVGDGQTYSESSRYLAGTRAVLADMPWGKMGMTICYDLRFPHLYRALGKAGAQIIMVPSAFTRVTGEAHWHVLLRARAIENGCFIVAPAQCGDHPGKRQTYGHSLVVAPWGNIIAELGEEEGVMMAEIDLDLSAQTRSKIPSLKHDRDFNFVI